MAEEAAVEDKGREGTAHTFCPWRASCGGGRRIEVRIEEDVGFAGAGACLPRGCSSCRSVGVRVVVKEVGGQPESDVVRCGGNQSSCSGQSINCCRQI